MPESKFGSLESYNLEKTEKTNIVLRGNKFVRRHDLTPSIRLYIAFMALTANAMGAWEKITELSRQFMISRTFVYMLANTLHETSLTVFGDTVSGPAVVEKMPYHYMLSLRLEGRCSIEAISTLMKRFGSDIASVGSISLSPPIKEPAKIIVYKPARAIKGRTYASCVVKITHKSLSSFQEKNLGSADHQIAKLIVNLSNFILKTLFQGRRMVALSF